MTENPSVVRLVLWASPVIVGMIATLIGVGVWDVYTNSDFAHARRAASYQAFSVEEKSAYWKGRIAAVGGTKAYDELAYLARDLITTKQHSEGHIFGKALYLVEGLAGVAVCDTRFMYSCFHSFMTQAILSEGVTAAQILHEACRASLGYRSENCEHGVGHGIQSMHAYDFAGLKKSLDVCGALTPPSHPVAGCAGGVFM